MNILNVTTKSLKNTMGAVAITVISVLAWTATGAVAKDNGDNKKRFEFYGTVQERPQDGRQGKWVIGGRTIVADRKTEFDETEGDLSLGGCAKVKIRNGRVHEIDSEPIHDCR